MASIFTKIINGQIPSRMLWEDDVCVAFLDVRPLAPGHSLVIPRAEIDQWTDLDATTATHLTEVAQAIGQAQMLVMSPSRIGLLIAGFEVAHAHMHVIPLRSMGDLDFANADTAADPSSLDLHMQELRSALSSAGHSAVSSR